MRRRRHVFAASMVVTAALSPGCDKQSSPETRERRTNNPPMPTPDGGAMAKTPMLDAAPAPAAKLIAPDPSFKAGNGATISLNQDTWTCEEQLHNDCPPGARCNPPPPEPVPCPDDLLPSLAPGVAETARKNGECFLDDVEVKCPDGLKPSP